MEINVSYRLPGEFERHSALYLLWPTRPDNWRDNAVHAQANLIQLANLLAPHEAVSMGFNTLPDEAVLRRLPRDVKAFEIEYDDIWVRDTGPMVVTSPSGPSIAVDWEFNSWGGLFDLNAADDAVARKIARWEGLSVVRGPIVLEGGAIATDGARTLVVTEESVLAKNRNPGLTRDEAALIFRRFLGAMNVIWLPRGLANDEAGGHVDNICAFASTKTLLVADTDDIDHPSYIQVKEAKTILERASNAFGQPYRLISVPLPPPTAITSDEASGFEKAKGNILRQAGTPLAPSYVNLYIANDLVVVPIFDVETDSAALEIISEVFPNRIVVPFRARDLLLGGGTIHCVTRDIPWKG